MTRSHAADDLFARRWAAGDLDGGSPEANAAQALRLILELLEPDRDVASFIAALPHCSAGLDWVDVRNTLATCGWATTLTRRQPTTLVESDFPCLLFAPSGEVSVLAHRVGDEVVVPRHGPVRATTRMRLRDVRGRIYLISASATTADKRTEQRPSMRRLARYRPQMLIVAVLTACQMLPALAVPLFMMALYDQLIPAGLKQPLIDVMLLLGGCLLVDLATRTLRAGVIARVGARLGWQIPHQALAEVLALPAEAVERASTDTQLARMQQFEEWRELLVDPVLRLLVLIPVSLILVVALAMIGGSLALLPLGAVAVIGLILWGSGRHVRLLESGAAKSRQERDRQVLELAAETREWRLLHAETVLARRLDLVSQEAARTGLKLDRWRRLTESVLQVTASLSGLAVLVLGAAAVMESTLSPGALIASYALCQTILAPWQQLTAAVPKVAQLGRELDSFDRLSKMTKEIDVIRRVAPLRVEGAVSFAKVTVMHAGAAAPIVAGLNLDVRPGELVLIRGPSGAGKSTVLRLAIGLTRARHGTVLIDGVDVRQIDAHELRRAVGYVPKHPHHFHGTVAQNLRIGKPSATDDELHAVAATLGLDCDLSRLPLGINTRLRDALDAKPSPGFLRRLALARVALRQPRLLLLDEPASDLDHESDAVLEQWIKRQHRKATIIIASHRPSHARLADRIVTLCGGGVAEVQSPKRARPMELAT